MRFRERFFAGTLAVLLLFGGIPALAAEEIPAEQEIAIVVDSAEQPEDDGIIAVEPTDDETAESEDVTEQTDEEPAEDTAAPPENEEEPTEESGAEEAAQEIVIADAVEANLPESGGLIDATSLLGSKITSYAAVDLQDTRLLVLGLVEKRSSARYYLGVYDTATKQQIIAKTELTTELCPIANILGARWDGKDRFLVYGVDRSGENGTAVWYDTSFQQRKKKRYTEPDATKAFQSSSFYTDSFDCIQGVASYRPCDTLKYLLFPSAKNDVTVATEEIGFPLAANKKRVLSRIYPDEDGPDRSVILLVNDYAAKRNINTTKIVVEQQDEIANIDCGDLNDQYACLALSYAELENSARSKLYLWNYNASPKNTPLQAETLNQASLDKQNKAIKTSIRSGFGVNVHVNALPDGEKPNGKISLVKLNYALRDMRDCLAQFPKGFVKEITSFEEDPQPLHIYLSKGLGKDFSDQYSGYARRDYKIALDINYYSSELLPHELMHEIDYRIYDYYEKKGLQFDTVWDGLNPSKFAYEYGENGQGAVDQSRWVTKYFVSGYAMTNECEDRADTFAQLFCHDIYYPYWKEKAGLKRKTAFLCRAIREAYPSMQTVQSTKWETTVPAYVAAKSIRLNETTLTLGRGEKATLRAMVAPSNATMPVAWLTSDDGVVGVSRNGKLTARATGTATITAIVDGQKATCRVRVALKKPKGVQAVNTAKGVSLSWKAVSKARGYHVYRQTGETGEFVRIATLKKGTTRYTDTGVVDGTVYRYRIAAIGKSGDGAWAKKKICFLKRPTLGKPVNTANKSVTVSWSRQTGVTGYVIRYRIGTAKAKTKTLRADSTKTTLTKLTKGKTCRICVQSYRVVGNKRYTSAWSAEKKITVKK